MGGLGTFALGVAAALTAGAIGPALLRRGRPLAREIVKQCIILGEGARVRADGLREDLQDLVAEAREDLRRQQAAGARDAEAGGAPRSTPT
jgi:hypothetical protein